VAVIHADSREVLETWSDTVRDALAGISTGYAKIHPVRANHLSATDARRLAPEEPVWGPRVEELDVLEHGARYAVRPASGFSVGLFLDMREVRHWLRGAAAGRSVLNTFGYTCAFGVSAMLGGAQRVVNLDISRRYLAWGQTNYRLNDLAVDPHDFVFGDAFDWLGRFARRGQRFEIVIVDPPSFSSTPFSVTRDYPRLVEAAARVVVPGGMLLAATNHAPTSDTRFAGWLQTGLDRAHRHGRLLQRWHEPQLDFPVAVGGEPYLKVRVLVLD
jgi:23S rRNA (cytosine1962-C5)-methyltransferase